MEFKKVIETKDGGVQVDAEFDADEVAFLIEYAVASLLRDGAMPFLAETASDVAPTTDTLQ